MESLRFLEQTSHIDSVYGMRHTLCGISYAPFAFSATVFPEASIEFDHLFQILFPGLIEDPKVKTIAQYLNEKC